MRGKDTNMNKKITIIDSETNERVTLTVTTKSLQSNLLRIASISGCDAVVEPDPSGDDADE